MHEDVKTKLLLTDLCFSVRLVSHVTFIMAVPHNHERRPISVLHPSTPMVCPLEAKINFVALRHCLILKEVDDLLA